MELGIIGVVAEPVRTLSTIPPVTVCAGFGIGLIFGRAAGADPLGGPRGWFPPR